MKLAVDYENKIIFYYHTKLMNCDTIKICIYFSSYSTYVFGVLHSHKPYI